MTGAAWPVRGLKLITNRMIGDTITPPMPDRLVNYKGPHRARKQKRWRLRNPPWVRANGSYILHEKMGVVYCHPDDFEKLKVEMEKAGIIRPWRDLRAEA